LIFFAAIILHVEERFVHRFIVSSPFIFQLSINIPHGIGFAVKGGVDCEVVVAARAAIFVVAAPARLVLEVVIGIFTFFLIIVFKVFVVNIFNNSSPFILLVYYA